jgi:hypothetical protein
VDDGGVLRSCNGFTDLRFSGLPFTWDNHQQEGNNIKVNLIIFNH